MTGATDVRIRVTVTDTWDTVTLDAGPDLRIADIKQRALAEATGRAVAPETYVVKFRGALILDELQSVRDAAIPNGAALIVLPARRHPVR